MAALITENFHSPLIRNHYQDRRLQAIAFLFTVGAKALVLEEQKSHQLPEYDGVHEEAEMRYKIVTQERIRTIKRKLLEKESIKLIKCGRNGKYRTIEVILEHDKKDETAIVWLSKYNYVKRFFLDKHTQIQLLEKPLNQSPGQVIDISSVSSSSPLPNNFSPVSKLSTPAKSRNPHHPTTEIIPIRLKNSQRVLDLFFFNPYEMEAFIMTLHRYSLANISALSHLFFHTDG